MPVGSGGASPSPACSHHTAQASNGAGEKLLYTCPAFGRPHCWQADDAKK